MHEWLYAENAYYSSMPTIGKDGDFATSVTTSMFFGGALANRLIYLIDSKKLKRDVCVIEIGAHHGYLMADIVQFIFTLKPELLKTLNFIIIEPQEKIKQAQQKYLHDSFGSEVKFTWYSDLSELKCQEAFIVTNELFDAFTCEVVKDGKMLYIDNHEPFFDKIDESTKKICTKYDILTGEVANGYEEFCFKLTTSIQKGEFITFDYGDIVPRNDISLRIYMQHKTYPFFSLTHFAKLNNDNLLTLQNLYQKSDLTYDVNFSHLFDAMNEAKFIKCEFSSQNSALIKFGLIDLLEILKKYVDEKQYRAELSKAMQLIDPSELGERFKMAMFQKGM